MNKKTPLWVAIALGLSSSMAYADSALSVNVTPLHASYGENSDVKVKVTITNQSSHNVKVLDWFLLKNNKLNSDAFDVSVNGQKVDYTGPIVKRPSPTDADYLAIGAGQTVTHTVDLSAYYDMTTAGTYNVQFDVSALNLIKQPYQAKSAAAQGPQSLSSNDVNFYVAGIDPKFAALAESKIAQAIQAKSGIDYVGNCSNSQRASISGAVQAAQSISSSAYNYLLDYYDNGSASRRYAQWFGTYSSSRYATVTQHFYRITDALVNKTVTADCGCDPDYASAFAYVYPNQPYHIHLCGAFWNAPTTGTDSKAGTLVHEMSHFTVNGGTDDVAYGQYNARQLARSNPAKAITNADSHEYFAENTPRID
ncbi:M35 family metallo-endopeptidase [Vibrio zhugei]|uniref:M35 family metallo-endopeptidase n=1 Tax=Vibrio zhugei TaxID=2479546 RepID=A0ABV7CEN2_9VIBR|nr:M35 family metallo-endopeptidase [Vibrio zhugei]